MCTTATVAQITAAIEHTFNMMDKDLSDEFDKQRKEYDYWHAKIRESARLRQIVQNKLDELKKKRRERVELERQTRNLEQSTAELTAALKVRREAEGDDDATDDASQPRVLFDLKKYKTLFPDSFNISSGLSKEQAAYLAEMPSVEHLRKYVDAYDELNKEICDEIEVLKSKSVVLGEQYRRMVMACTGWSAEQVDAAAEGLLECVKDLNQDPVPEEEALEILMQDRGQDW